MTLMAKEGQSLVMYGDVEGRTIPVAVMIEKDEPITPPSFKL